MSDEVIVGPKKEFFTWLPNCIVYEWGLSAEALGVALYLNGKPAGWRTRPFDIQKHFGFKKTVWTRISKELRACGLLQETRGQADRHLRFVLPDMNLAVSKNPQGAISTPSENHKVRKPALLAKKEDLPKKDLLNKKDILCEKEIKLIFEKLWSMYPHKKAKGKALEALTKILRGKTKGEAKLLSNAIWDGLVAHVAEHETKKDLESQGAKVWVPELPHLSTWINQSRWEDGYSSPEQILAAAKPKGGILDIDTVF